MLRKEFVSRTGMSYPKRILLIEHEPHLTTKVGEALQATGQYLIRQEEHSHRALHSARHFQPDLILLDAAPENLKVDQIAQQIQADESLADVPVLCLTSVSRPGHLGSIGFLGGYTFVANPFLVEDMVSCIGEMLQEKRRSEPSAEVDVAL